MDVWSSLFGMVTVELTSAEPTQAMAQCNRMGIALFGVVWVDGLTVRFRLRRSDYRKLKALVQRRGDRLRLAGRRGSYWVLRGMLRRPILLGGGLLFLCLSLWLPSRILFVQIEGNTQIPTRKILEQAQICGIDFGAKRRDVRSEKMKNALLEAIPELQWAGINTSGCTAVISVRERTQTERTAESGGVSSLVAAVDGVILEMTVTRGNPLCKVGQAVKAGQVLVSGYTDCGICVRAEQAQGEIFGETSRKSTVSMAANYVQKGEITALEKKYSLLLGKKRINFYKGSGILDTTCDKMYAQTYLLLPGGFQLPVALVTEQWTWRETADAEYPEAEARQLLSRQAADGLKRQMVAGTIRQKYETLHREDGVFRLYGRYVCTEMICKTRTEEKLPNYAETG